MQVSRASYCPQALQSLNPGIQPASGALVTGLLQSLLTQCLPLWALRVTEHIWMVSRRRNLVGWTGRARGEAQPQGDFLVLQVPAAWEVGALVVELGALVVGGGV